MSDWHVLQVHVLKQEARAAWNGEASKTPGSPAIPYSSKLSQLADLAQQ